MSTTVRLGLVGAGVIAQAHVQSIRELEGLTIGAIVDVREPTARSLAEDCGCQSFCHHEELAANGHCDAVVVCTPPSSHLEVCLSFLEAGIPVLCEKPLTLDVTSAERLLAAAERNRVPFTMASKFRYVDDVVRAKSMVDSGVLGEVILFENAFASHVDMSRRWNSDPKISGGGVLIDNGTHSVDLIRYFLGPIAEVQAVEGKRIQSLVVEDTVQLFVRTQDGVMGTVDLSWSLNKELDHFVNIYGSGGAVRVGWSGSSYRRSSNSGWTTFGSGYDKLGAFRKQLENFRAAILGEEPLRITAEDALASVHVIEAAYRSLQENHWVKVDGLAG